MPDVDSIYAEEGYGDPYYGGLFDSTAITPGSNPANILYGGGFFYAGGSFYGGTEQDVPLDFRFYRTNVEGRYVFHWGFRFDFITPLLSSMTYELQIASDPLFTEDLSTYDNLTAISYQNGNVRKGFAIDVAPRLDKIEQTWYARVRTVLGFAVSDWSDTLPFVIPQRFEVEESENIVNNLPDFHVYGKEDLLKAVADRNSNLYTVANMYGKELDSTLIENFLTTTNNFIGLCRDEQLFDNFGTFFGYIKPQNQQFVEYRMCLLNLILASLVGGTNDAVERIVRSFTGVNPNLQFISTRQDFFLDTILEVPVGAVDGSNTTYQISSDFITGSIVVLQNGLVLTSGVDFTENHSIPGFVMTVPPAPLDTLDVLFRIGLPGDPAPLVFDINDTSPLTGTFTFMNNNSTVMGSGTLFLSELVSGDAITDSEGLILGVVDNVTTNTLLTLTGPWLGTSGSGTGKKLNYSESQVPPSILWDKGTLAFGLNIQVLNPGLFNLNRSLIEMLVKLILPSHIRVFFEYI